MRFSFNCVIDKENDLMIGYAKNYDLKKLKINLL